MTTPETATVPLTGFAQVNDRFDLCLCDIWGVVHNGVAAHREAVEALMAMRAAGTTVVLVTNAPRPRGEILRQLDGFGVPRTAYDAIVTSGDVCRDLIAARAGQPLYMLGPDRDLPLLAGLDAPRVGPDEAGYVLCTGLFDDETETAATYADASGRLRRARAVADLRQSRPRGRARRPHRALRRLAGAGL